MAHGSKDPRAADAADGMLALVRSRAASQGLPGLNVRAAFLDHAAPSLPQVLGSLAPAHDQCVVVPLLLAPAYHAKIDIPGQTAKIRSAYPGLEVATASALGPHPLLLRALERRVREAWDGPREQTSVVLAAAGSSDPSANAANAALAGQLRDLGGWRRVVTGYASAASPPVAEAVADLRSDGPVVVATYLLAPGYFADKVRDTALAAGAAAVSDPLGAAPEIAEVIISRYRAAAGGHDAAPLAARALLSERIIGPLPVTGIPHTG